ncbi:MAG TPA: prephenate dehydratase, partial [bacterium]|nr:prephenate dehydratase [bacterium]
AARLEGQMGKSDIRRQIDAVDEKILKLLSERAELALKTARFKRTNYDPAREKKIIARLAELNEGPLDEARIEAVWREILSACRGLQKLPTVAFLGPRATFSHAAALKKFGSNVIERPCEDISMVFDDVEKGLADYGVVPFENSNEGAVNNTLDRLATTPLAAVGEIYSEISLNLMAKHDNFKEIKKIYTHPKALEQCAEWLKRNARGKEIEQVSSTAVAAQRAARFKSAAAVAGELAADIYGLKIIRPRIEDHRDNKTRFLVMGREKNLPSGDDKTSALFSVRHEPGTLYRALKSFEKHNLNLTMMLSRPSPTGRWEYMFFVDLEGHESDENVKAALKDMRRETIVLKAIGSYPKEKA